MKPLKRLTQKEWKKRRKQAAERARRWREAHPKEWAEIQRRSREKRRKLEQKQGVEVELVI